MASMLGLFKKLWPVMMATVVIVLGVCIISCSWAIEQINSYSHAVDINAVRIEMEVDSKEEHSTVPLSLFKQNLSGVCKLKPSRVSLYQYDKSPLTIARECQATVRINKVERQLQQQVQEEELVPVDRSDWVTPIVVVHKKDGGIRICSDFKVSINPVLQSQTYPLPTPEEMFSALPRVSLTLNLI